MDKKEYTIKEIKKYKRERNKIYTIMATIPATILASVAVTGLGLHTGLTTEPGFLLGLGGLVSTYFSVKKGVETLDNYDRPTTIVSPSGANDWSHTEPSLKDQLKSAKENLVLLQAELINDNKGKGR